MVVPGGYRVPQVESIFLNMPNLHFLPCNPVTSKVCALPSVFDAILKCHGAAILLNNNCRDLNIIGTKREGPDESVDGSMCSSRMMCTSLQVSLMVILRLPSQGGTLSHTANCEASSSVFMLLSTTLSSILVSVKTLTPVFVKHFAFLMLSAVLCGVAPETLLLAVEFLCKSHCFEDLAMIALVLVCY